MNYEIFDTPNSIDLLLSFDSHYDGEIFQNEENGLTSLTLKNLASEQKYTNSINSNFLFEVIIAPHDNMTILTLKGRGKFDINATMIRDGFSLRIGIKPANFTEVKITDEAQTKASANGFSSAFTIIFAALCVLIFIGLIYVTKKLFFNKTSYKKLDEMQEFRDEFMQDFKQESSNQKIVLNDEDIKQKTHEIEQKEDLSVPTIIFQKAIDDENRVVLLRFEDKNYLVLLGSSNLLLDRFGEDFIHSQSDFQKFFDKNRQKLQNFIKDQNNFLTSYIQKASKD